MVDRVFGPPAVMPTSNISPTAQCDCEVVFNVSEADGARGGTGVGKTREDIFENL